MTEDNATEEEVPTQVLPAAYVPIVLEEVLPNISRQVPVEFWNCDLDWTHFRALLNTFVAGADGTRTPQEIEAAALKGLNSAIARWQWDVEALRDEVDGVAI